MTRRGKDQRTGAALVASRVALGGREEVDAAGPEARFAQAAAGLAVPVAQVGRRQAVGPRRGVPAVDVEARVVVPRHRRPVGVEPDAELEIRFLREHVVVRVEVHLLALDLEVVEPQIEGRRPGSEKGDFFSPFSRLLISCHVLTPFRLISWDERSPLVEFSKSGPFP